VPLHVLCDSTARRAMAIQPGGVEELPHDRRYTTRPVKSLAEILPGGLDIGQQGNLVSMLLPLLTPQFDTSVPRDRGRVWLYVRGTTDRRVDANRIQKASPC
jgi:hypothetical protein